MIGDRQQQARLQSAIYFRTYHLLLRALLVSLCLMILLLFAIAGLVVFRAPPNYYATTTDGRIAPMVATA